MSLGSRSGVNWMRQKAGRDALGQGLADQRLADARHVFEQHVVAGQQRHDAQPHDVGLAEHDLADVRFELGHEVLQLCRHARLPTRLAVRSPEPSRTGPSRDCSDASLGAANRPSRRSILVTCEQARSSPGAGARFRPRSRQYRQMPGGSSRTRTFGSWLPLAHRSDSRESTGGLRRPASARPRRGSCPACRSARRWRQPSCSSDDFAIADQLERAGQRRLGPQPQAGGQRHFAAHRPGLVAAIGAKDKARRIGDPVEGHVGPAGLQRFPHGLLGDFVQQQVRADVAKAARVGVQIELEHQRRPASCRATSSFERRQLLGIELGQFLAQRVLELDLAVVGELRPRKPWLWCASLAETPVCRDFWQSWSQRFR